MERRLLLDSEPEAAPRAARFAEAAAVEVGLPTATADRLVLALAEAVANAVEHGNAFVPERKVRVEWEKAEGALWFFVEDEGEGLSAEQLNQAKLPDDAMEMGGRGLFIIRTLADDVRLEHGGRRLGLRFAPRANEAA